MKLTRVLAILVLAISLFSCTQQSEKLIVPENPAIQGLASVIKLEAGPTEVILEDYFADPAQIESISSLTGLNISWKPGDAVAVVSPVEGMTPPMSSVQCKIGEVTYSILAERSKKIKHSLTFDPQGKTYESVQLAGAMNDWVPGRSPFELIDGVWKVEFLVNPGYYPYQLVLDGNWRTDPANPDSADNNLGAFNSVMKVGDLDPSKKPVLNTLSSEEETIQCSYTNNPETIYIFWQNYRLPTQYYSLEDGLMEIEIPSEAKSMERSFIRVYAYNEFGIGNDLLIPLEYGNVINDPEQIKRSDKESITMYFMLVDRFNNGNKANDQPVDDPDVDPRANYWGGDIAGITEKIRSGWFSALGVNTIWLSPITQNPLDAYIEWPAPHRKFSGYHGYWPTTLTTIDHRFGTEAELKELVAEAHKRYINVFLDFVSNHVHENNQMIIDHPDWKTDLILEDGSKNIRIWEEKRLTTWFDTFLPTLDLRKPEVIEAVSDSAMFWIKNYNLDGFRHDATKHIPEDYWRSLTKKVKMQVAKRGEPVFQIGETFGSRELIGSYVGSGQLDGQFDFNLYFDSRDVFVNDEVSFKKLAASMMGTFDYYGYHHLMGNITGNHDMARFIAYASEALAFDENDKEAGWSRDITIKNPFGYKKLSSLTAFIMTIPGVPVIYYGDEIGMVGAGDPDNRRPMKFMNLKQPEREVLDKARKLVNIRKDNLALIYGDLEFLEVSDDILVYQRTYFDNIAIVFFNKSGREQNISVELPERFHSFIPDMHFGSGFSLNNGVLSVKVKAREFEIVTN